MEKWICPDCWNAADYCVGTLPTIGMAEGFIVESIGKLFIYRRILKNEPKGRISRNFNNDNGGIVMAAWRLSLEGMAQDCFAYMYIGASVLLWSTLLAMLIIGWVAINSVSYGLWRIYALVYTVSENWGKHQK
jgi:hypothetical protein